MNSAHDMDYNNELDRGTDGSLKCSSNPAERELLKIKGAGGRQTPPAAQTGAASEAPATKRGKRVVPIPFRLDYAIERTLGNERINQARVIRRLTDVKLSSAEAQAQWPRLLEHKWYLSERLNRDVGLRVAAVDYFENIYQAPGIYKRRDMLPQRLPMMQPLIPVG